jgi:hypothetical protein
MAKNKKMIIPHRSYQVCGFAQGGFQQEITLEELMTEQDDAFEFIYALQEELDKILDLKVNECINFNPSRDNKSFKGVIGRTA